MEWDETEISIWNMEDSFPYFHFNSILDFAYSIYRKIYTDSDNQQYLEAFSS